MPGALDAIARLSRAGWTVAVATNQSGLARGYYSVPTLESMHQVLRDEVQQRGGAMGLISYCPHGPDEGCACRKPGLSVTACVTYRPRLPSMPNQCWSVAEKANKPVRNHYQTTL